MSRHLQYRLDSPYPLALVRENQDEFGLGTIDLIAPPLRLARGWKGPRLSASVDARTARGDEDPSAWLERLPEGESWKGVGTRTLSRLRAWFLVCEDPERRLDAKEVATLAHQASLVRHVLDSSHLDRVLIGDEVGLGKTIEAGLIIHGLLEQNEHLRILYLAPARLVPNVNRELRKLGLYFRTWASGADSTADLESDPKVIASIHRATHKAHLDKVEESGPWDVLIIDECHHLSDWDPGGGKPVLKYQLADRLIEQQAGAGRVILMSGTPHQGHRARFENLLRLLRRPHESDDLAAKRVIFRIKDHIKDWDGHYLFPRRRVNDPVTIDLTRPHREWLAAIRSFYHTAPQRNGEPAATGAKWRSAQALQWASSSVQAGLGYLVRQAVRLGWELDIPELRKALELLRPYRLGPPDEPVEQLFGRIGREVGKQQASGDIEDIEEVAESAEAPTWDPDPELLKDLLRQGAELLAEDPDRKWLEIDRQILSHAGDEKVVLFAQPIESVTALSSYLERKKGVRPALIVGNQKEAERDRQLRRFWRPDGPQYLVSSRAGSEGFNMQVARRLVHVDVPWNPMELEQRVGRVHRFGSRQEIVVDTVLVRDTREVDMYKASRTKLAEVATSLQSDDSAREDLFARIMCLIPPTELQDIMEADPMAGFDDEDRRHISTLIEDAYRRWEEFHEAFRARRALQDLDPGQAQWSDVIDWIRAAVPEAEEVDGCSVLGFEERGGEVREASRPVQAFQFSSDRRLAFGDHGGLPVLDADDNPVPIGGLNSEELADTLERHAFPDRRAGVAHFRWPAHAAWPFASPTAGLLVYARQTVQLTESPPRVTSPQLLAYAVEAGGAPRALEGAERADILRTLWRADILTQMPKDAAAVRAVRDAHAQLCTELRRPTPDEQANGMRHGLFPLSLAIVAKPSSAE